MCSLFSYPFENQFITKMKAQACFPPDFIKSYVKCNFNHVILESWFHLVNGLSHIDTVGVQKKNCKQLAYYKIRWWKKGFSENILTICEKC